MDDHPSSLAPSTAPRSRRRFLMELAGAAAVIAIPVGAAVATARPIANAPSRESLGVLSTERQELIEQRREPLQESDQNSDWKRAREERKRARQSRKEPGTPAP